MRDYIENIGYLVDNNDFEDFFDQYLNLNNHKSFYKSNPKFEFLVFENESAFDKFQNKFYNGTNNKNSEKYYFIAFVGSLLKLYIGLILPIEEHKNDLNYYILFKDKFDRINYKFN
jgi:hypothetical protein